MVNDNGALNENQKATIRGLVLQDVREDVYSLDELIVVTRRLIREALNDMEVDVPNPARTPTNHLQIERINIPVFALGAANFGASRGYAGIKSI